MLGCIKLTMKTNWHGDRSLKEVAQGMGTAYTVSNFHYELRGVAYDCNPSTPEAEQEDRELEAITSPTGHSRPGWIR